MNVDAIEAGKKRWQGLVEGRRRGGVGGAVDEGVEGGRRRELGGGVGEEEWVGRSGWGVNREWVESGWGGVSGEEWVRRSSLFSVYVFDRLFR